MNCEKCEEAHDTCPANNIECGLRACKNWCHKSCMSKNQIARNGFFYCKIHIKDLPADLIPLNTEIRKNIEQPVSDTVHEQERNKSVTVNDTVVTPPPNISKDNVLILETEKELHVFQNNLVPYDNGDETNPFSNFACDTCGGAFTRALTGVLCVSCRTTFHKDCISDSEKENINNSQFVCQPCIQEIIRLESLKKKHNLEVLPNKDKPPKTDRARNFTNSTPKRSKSKPLKKPSLVSIRNCSSSSSSSDSFISDLSDSDRDIKSHKLYEKYQKLKRRIRKSKNKYSSDESSQSSEDEMDITQENAMLSLYKLTKEERIKSKFEKLPIVEHADTKWSVFFDLFKKSRKHFSDSENILRLQKAIKSKEILDIGGISLFDPRTYWESLKMINKRLCHSYNLLQKETSEIIKLKKLRGDSDPKKSIELINKIINYSHIIQKYGSKKHKIDDRVISHIGNILPNNLVTGWHKIKSKLEDDDKSVKIKHIAEYLSKQVSHLTSKIQGEELDPWREHYMPKPNYNSKRSYHVTEKKDESVDSSNFCWYHKSNKHSAFKCSKLWELSGQEVSKLARDNNICTFCGYKRHAACHASRNLNCRLEGCNFKHHMLFCFRRKGKADKNVRSNHVNHKNMQKKKFHSVKNVERNNRSSRPCKENENNSQIRKVDSNNSQSEESEVEVPQSNFYINEAPRTIKVKSQNIKFNANPHLSSHFREEVMTLNTLYNIKSKRTASCILGVIVIKVVESNEKIALLLDSGSTVSLIDQKLADKLELKGIWNPLRLSWSNNISRMDYGSRIVNIQVSPLGSDSKQFSLYLRTVNDLNMHDQPFDAHEMMDCFPHLKPLHLQSYSKIHGIVGLDNMWAFDQHKVIKPKNWKPHVPYGIKSPLGDFVVGNVNQLEDVYAYLRNSNDNSQFNANFFAHQLKMTEREEEEYIEIEKAILGSEYNKLDDHDNDLYNDTVALEILNKKVRKARNNVNYEAPLL